MDALIMSRSRGSAGRTKFQGFESRLHLPRPTMQIWHDWLSLLRDNDILGQVSSKMRTIYQLKSTQVAMI